MYPMNPEALHRMFKLEHEYRLKQIDCASYPVEVSEP